MRLYKYCDLGGVEIIRTCSIKVSCPLELNDPFDCNPNYDVTTPSSRSALEKILLKYSELGQAIEAGVIPGHLPAGLTLDHLKGFWRQVCDRHLGDPIRIQEAFTNSRSNILVLCLSANKNHPLMWSHYTRGHQGMMIEFETDRMFAPPELNSVTDFLFEVQYSKQRPKYRFDDQSLEHLKVKSEIWQYEQEWRCLYTKQQFDLRVVNGAEMYLKAFHPGCIKAVYLGCCIPQSHQVEIRRLLSREQHEGVELYQMKVDENDFSLRAVEIPLTHHPTQIRRIPAWSHWCSA